MTNSVEIDDAAIAAELKQLEGEYIPRGEGGPSPGAGPGGPSEPPHEPGVDWTAPAGLLILIFDKLVAPNWELQPEEKQLLHEQTTMTLQVCFPEINIDPRILAVMSLGGAFVMVAQRRYDPETGKLKPLRATHAEPDDTANAGADRTAS